MRKLLSVVLTLFVFAVALSGCTEHPASLSSKKSNQNDYDFTLGKKLDIDFEADDWYEKLEELDGVSQIVYDRVYDEQAVPPIVSIPRAAYIYDDFPKLVGAGYDDAPLFKDKYKLYMDVCTLRYTILPTPIAITEPSVFGAFEEFIMQAEFVVGEAPNTFQLSIPFKLVDSDNGETEYTLFRDGHILRGDGMVAKTPLGEDELAYFFALYPSYAFVSAQKATYVNGYSLSHTAIRIYRDGSEAALLKGEHVEEFLRLVSDARSDESFDYEVSGAIRLNCGAGEHGKEAMRFEICDFDPDTGEFSEAAPAAYSLYSDGTVVRGIAYLSSFYPDYFCYDSLNVDRYFVSSASFDVNAILAFCDSHGGN